MSKVVTAVVGVIVLIPIALVGLLFVLYHQALDRGPSYATKLYEAARDGRLGNPATSEVASKKLIEQMKAEDLADGKVRSFRIVNVGAQITGLPWYVDLEVRRGQTTQRETVLALTSHQLTNWFRTKP